MVIINQERDTIINFNRVVQITIDEYDIICLDNDYNEIILGIYEDEDRFNQVFNELINACETNTSYEMPKE